MEAINLVTIIALGAMGGVSISILIVLSLPIILGIMVCLAGSFTGAAISGACYTYAVNQHELIIEENKRFK